jgi:hypothetical protein
MDDLYSKGFDMVPAPGTKIVPASLAELITDPSGLLPDSSVEGAKVAPELELKYRHLLSSSLQEIEAAPGTLTVVYMLMERYVYSYMVMKDMEKRGYANLEERKYARAMNLFLKTANTVLDQLKKIMGDQTNLQYLFISDVMETLVGTMDEMGDKLPAAESERLKKSVRDNLNALVQKQQNKG